MTLRFADARDGARLRSGHRGLRGLCGARRGARPGDQGRGHRAGGRDVHQGHRADPAAQLPELPPARPGGADVAPHLRRGAAVGARPSSSAPRIRDKAARCRPGTSRRTSASSSTRTTRRCQRRGSGEDRASGPTPARRAATPPTCRAPLVFADEAPVDHRRARPDRRRPRDHREGERARLVGRAAEPTKIPLDEDRYVAAVEIKEVNDIDTTEQGPRTPWAGATCTTT